MLYTKIVLKSKYFCSEAIFWENPLDNCFCRLYTLLKKRKQIRSVTIKGEKDMLEKMLAEQLNCEASTITPETSFKDDLGADSLDLFELVMALEDEYNVEIPAEELTDLNTVGDVIDYLKNKGVEA